VVIDQIIVQDNEKEKEIRGLKKIWLKGTLRKEKKNKTQF